MTDAEIYHHSFEGQYEYAERNGLTPQKKFEAEERNRITSSPIKQKK